MNRLVSAAWVIARRDYVATVFSKLFLLFLIGPVLIFATVGLITALGGSGGKGPAGPPVVAVTFGPTDLHQVEEARSRLAARLGPGGLPVLSPLPLPKPGGAAALLRRDEAFAAVLSGTLADPALTTIAGAPDGIGDDVGLLLDTARAQDALGHALPPPTQIARHAVALAASGGGDAKAIASDRADLARSGQITMFFFILLLAGMLLSNFIEEKSNKVIELLAAAVPVDAIFIGKLAGMLAISLTSIAVWGGATGLGLFSLMPGMLAGLTVPAVGWPLFVLLGIVYFITTYLLVGAVLLGIGSQAASPREVQTLSLPVTMAQALLLTFASVGAAHPDGWIAIASAIFPWSSPLAMLGRAAEVPALWPHLLAIVWQIGWLVLAIRFAAHRFRSGVLKSGGGRRAKGAA